MWHKILFFMRGKNWLRARLHYLSRGHVSTARYCLQFAGVSLRAWLSRLHGQLLYVCGPSEELYDNKTHVSGTLWLPRGAPESLQNKAKVEKLGPWGDGVPQEKQHHGSHLAGHTIGVMCQHRVRRQHGRFHPQTKGEKRREIHL